MNYKPAETAGTHFTRYVLEYIDHDQKMSKNVPWEYIPIEKENPLSVLVNIVAFI